MWLLPVAVTLVCDIFVFNARCETAVMGNSLRRARLENILALRAMQEKHRAKVRQETAERMKMSATRKLTVLRQAAEDLRRAEETIGTFRTEADSSNVGCESRKLEQLIQENEAVLSDPLAAADSVLSWENETEPEGCFTLEELAKWVTEA